MESVTQIKLAKTCDAINSKSFLVLSFEHPTISIHSKSEIGDHYRLPGRRAFVETCTDI